MNIEIRRVDGLSITVERRPIRRMYMLVNRDGSVTVRCPRFTSAPELDDFILSHRRWLARAEHSVLRQQELNAESPAASHIYWLGDPVPVLRRPGRRNVCSLQPQGLLFTLKDSDSSAGERAFQTLAVRTLKAMAARERTPWDEKICDARGLPRPTIQIRRMTTRWGVCHIGRGTITLSTRLIHYPPDCFSYVLLHEYAHFLVGSHSKRFYQIVARYMPDYEKAEKALKGEF
jgi:predicted metal-dependent hydrolase